MALLRRVLDAPLPDGMDREIIVADDASTDGSVETVEELSALFSPWIFSASRDDAASQPKPMAERWSAARRESGSWVRAEFMG